MSITSDDVLRMAERARLRLSVSEAAALTADLTMILEYVVSLSSAPISEGPAPVLGPPQAPERGKGQLSIDPLTTPPSQFAEHFRDGFFVIPSPPSLGDTSDRDPSPHGDPKS